MFENRFHFNGTYRPYQQRTLDNIDAFLDNDKIHIVAAPGSGKTTLGLELILRLDSPSLILAPSITIREQWISRFKESFANNEDVSDYISNDLLNAKPITCITYQALYSAFKKIKNEVDEDEEIENEELKDYSSFDLFAFLDKNNIKTICLDECHHLRSEWWKALENTIAHIQNVKIIALTATPPYDSSLSEWQRYIDLCGPIDYEIFVPELINDKNLCPHQDYIYFSMPTKDEEKDILKYYSYGKKTFYKYKNDPELLEIIKQNTIYQDKKEFKKALYRDTAYYHALLCYLNENNVKIDPVIKILTDVEPLNIHHFEIVLQNVLFDDVSSYPTSKKILSMKKEFSSLGITNRRKINLSHDERIDRILAGSVSKLHSIEEIVRYEMASLKSDMKCLVLTDFIKIKSKNKINNLDLELTSFGTVPIFEHLRRADIPHTSLCLLSGSICIVPKKCQDRIVDESFEIEDLSGTDYIEVKVKASNRKKIVAIVTELFQEGTVNVVIGTKSLLGEGWDSPCINTLIMATYIGSYVISNQTRGRAIRTDPKQPNKISNVWHLVCLNPYDDEYNEDFNTVKRRFSSFVGISYDSKNVESGISRLGLTNPPKGNLEMKIENNRMQKEAINRNKTEKKWNECLKSASQIEQLTKITYLDSKRVRKSASFYIALMYVILYGGLIELLRNLQSNLEIRFNFLGILDDVLFYVAQGVALLILLFNLYRVIIQATRRLHLRFIGIALVRGLKSKGIIKSKHVKVITFNEDLETLGIYLRNASTYEQNMFSESIVQMLSEIKQPRYLICRPRNFSRREVYIVPDIFKKNKESVKCFTKPMNFFFGKYQTVFAKSEQGKDIVIFLQFIYKHLYKNSNISTKQVLIQKKFYKK